MAQPKYIEHLTETVVRIDERTAAIKDLLTRHISDDEEVQDDHEARLRAGERFRNITYGGFALCVIVGGGGVLSLFN